MSEIIIEGLQAYHCQLTSVFATQELFLQSPFSVFHSQQSRHGVHFVNETVDYPLQTQALQSNSVQDDITEINLHLLGTKIVQIGKLLVHPHKHLCKTRVDTYNTHYFC